MSETEANGSGSGQYFGSIRESFGSFVHSHGHAGELLNEFPDVAKEVGNYQDARVYLETTISYLDELGGQEMPLALVDTEHAAHGIPGLAGGDFPSDPAKIAELRQQFGAVALERAKLIRNVNESGRYQTKLFSGIEVDVLNISGELDLEKGCLDQLDLVIASLHPDEFRKVNGEFTKTAAMTAYLRTAQNPSVDVLGHPSRHLEELKEEIGGLPSIEEWDPVLQAMKENKVAYEINIRPLTISQYDLQVIERAAQIGCDFSIGFDFHHFEYFNQLGRNTPEQIRDNWGELTPAEEKILNIAEQIEGKNDAERETYFRENLTAQERARLRFMESKGQPNFELFLRLRRIIKTLTSIGVSKEHVINTSPEQLDAWLKAKHGQEQS